MANAELLPGEQFVRIPCRNCGVLIEVPEGRVRLGWAKDDMGRIIKRPLNQCQECSRLYDNYRHERDQEAELGPNRTEAATTLLGHMKKTGE